MINMDPDAAWRVTEQTAIKVRRLSTGFVNMSSTDTLLPSSFSLLMAALISEASVSTSASTGRSHRRALTPSSYRPLRMSQRGDSGMKNRATVMMVGTM
jgi:hypothetical protein